MSALLFPFLDPAGPPSLKICGVRTAADAHQLASLGVEALGLNFWPRSKRYCSLAQARHFAPGLAGQILRVGVYVNAPITEPQKAYEEGLIDLVQFHGDESLDFLTSFAKTGVPFLKAVALTDSLTLRELEAIPTATLLLDAHAPGVYGGTGETVDWDLARQYVATLSDHSILLAGGITPLNAEEAARHVRPCALDVASGAESAPGVKDFTKVQLLQNALRSAATP